MVAVKTDQPNIKRRLDMILAALHPVQEPPNTEAQVAAREVGELTANDFDALAYWFGPEAVRRLNVGDVVTPCADDAGPGGSGGADAV